MDPREYFDEYFTPDPTTQSQNQSSQPNANPPQNSSQTITNDLIDISQPIPDLLNDNSPVRKPHPIFPVDTKNQPLSKSQNIPAASNNSKVPNWMNDDPFSPTALSKSSIDSRTQSVSFATSSYIDNSPTRENLTGIYAFFGSRELPPNPKQITLADIPAGTESIPFVFQNRCYHQGIELMTQFMKLSATAEDKMYYRILKIMCMIKLSMWDKVALEYSIIGNLDKIMMETKSEVNIPYHLRLLYALTPLLSASSQSRSTISIPSTRPSEDKTIDRLFGLYYFCESKVGELTYNDEELYKNESLDMFTICDADIPPKQWMARLFRTTLLILEIMLYKGSTATANEFIRTALQRFPKNDLIMAYMVRLKHLQGDFVEANFFIEKINQKLPKDEFLEFVCFNKFLQMTNEMNYQEARSLLEQLAQKFPQYSTLAENNLAFLQFSQGRVKEAIDILENLIRTEPWNINEIIALNLLHLYDFYYLDHRARKKVIEEIVDRYATNFNKGVLTYDQKS